MSNDGSGVRPSAGERRAQEFMARKLKETFDGHGTAVPVDWGRLGRPVDLGAGGGGSDRDADPVTQMCRLSQDDDGHWYVIPADKENEWGLYIEAVTRYWDELPEGEECPDQPEWVVEVGGGYGLVKFWGYEIE